MNRMLVALSAVCLPMLSVAAPPLVEPVDVTVTNPVLPVEVSNADPIPVMITGGAEAFQAGSVATAISGNIGSTSVVTVPTDKVLVIEHVSAWVNSSGDGGMLAVSLSAGAGSGAMDLMCQPLGSNSLNYTFSCGGPAKYYAQPGTTLVFVVQTIAATGGFFRVFVSGHYEPAP